MATATTGLAQRPVSTAYPPVGSDFTRADQISKYCTDLASRLNQAPLFDGSDTLDRTSKVIALANPADARICDIFSTNSAMFLGSNRAWHIHSFGSGQVQFHDRNGVRVHPGVSLSLYDGLESCSLEELKASYDQVYTRMTTGWIAANIQDYPNIITKKNIHEFDLFIKEGALVEEETLIRFIASRFSLRNELECDREWLPGSTLMSGGKLYLGIRKSALATVVEKIGFRFASKL